MMRSNQPSLPANRAFVVQIHADAQLEQGDCKGRVEHLTSMQVAHFDSSEALLAFMARILTAQQQAKAAMSEEDED
jgi:hypothetical protein